MPYYLGVISGTSMDAIDVVTLQVEGDHLLTTGHFALPYPSALRRTLEQLCHPEQGALENELEMAAEADVKIGELISEAVQEALKEQGLLATDITAIGSHGQNIRHRPDSSSPFTYQIGNPSVIAERTGITTVADFRMADIAAGGQGAPLAPAFHLAAFGLSGEARGILNLGGIANITCLFGDSEKPVIGYDIGPANTLMDQWCLKHRNRPFDENGDWALSGRVVPELLELLLQDDYFKRPTPKSTGREHFNLRWLQQSLNTLPGVPPEDVQRSLLELSAQSIAQDLNRHTLDTVYLCGGGVENRALIQRLNTLLNARLMGSTSELGIHPQHVEAAAFAWFAHQTMNRKSANLPSVTGARRAKVLGGIYPA